jgi:hypothetical protein
MISKRNILWLDISLFFIVIAVAQSLFVLLLEQLSPSTGTLVLAVFFLVGLIGAFLRFTFRPPQEPDVFIDPINKKYGLSAHPDIK